MSLLSSIKKYGLDAVIFMIATFLIVSFWIVFYFYDSIKKDKFCNPDTYEQTVFIKSNTYIICIDSKNSPILRKYQDE